jgi:hypothetical protein
MNSDAGKKAYYFHFTPFATLFYKGIQDSWRRGSMDITEVYVTSKDHREKKVGDNIRGKVANFSATFATPMRKVLKFRLQKYLLQSIFDSEGKHDWFNWSDHGGKSAKYIL